MEKARKSKHHFYSKIKMSAKESFLLTEKELKRLNSTIRTKKLNDTHFGHSIFNSLRGEISDKKLEIYANDHFTAGYNSFLDIKEKMIEENCFDYKGIRKYGYLINLIIYDLRPFANYVGKKIDPNYIFFDGGSTNIEDTIWHYLGTKHLVFNSVHENKMLDDKFAIILSAVSLRQTVELKMQRILGIADFEDLNGEKIFTSHNFFFDFILKHKTHFDLSKINLKIVQKVFEFCNLSVHKGIMPFYWQMFYAFKFCDSIFYDPDYKQRPYWSIHSAIRISNYEKLKQKIEESLKMKFPEPTYNLYITWIRPEAQILN